MSKLFQFFIFWSCIFLAFAMVVPATRVGTMVCPECNDMQDINPVTLLVYCPILLFLLWVLSGLNFMNGEEPKKKRWAYAK